MKPRSSDPIREEVYHDVEGCLDNCGYLDVDTVNAAFGALVDWCRDNKMSVQEIGQMVTDRLNDEPYGRRKRK